MNSKLADIAAKFGTTEVSSGEVYKVFGNAHYNALLKEGTKVRRGVFNLPGAVAKAAPQVAAETDDEIRTKLKLRFSALRKMTQAAAMGLIPATIISGPAGLGKTFEVEEELNHLKTDFIFVKGHVSPVGLFTLLWENKEKGKVLVFDDADSIFSDETSLNLLKAATDSTDKRTLSWLSPSSYFEERGIDQQFEFKGSVIFITNLDFDAMVTKGVKMAPHFEALISRSHYLDLAMKSKRDYLVRIQDVVRLSGMMKSRGMGTAEGEMILGFIDQNADRMRELSLRVVAKLAHLVKMDPKGWQDVARITLMK